MSRTLRSLVICTALPAAGAGFGMPATAVAAATTPVSSEATNVRTYAIGPGLLADVLADFAGASGVALSFDPTLLQARRSDGLRGTYSVREGFDRLLGGTGYELVARGQGAYTLRRRPTPASDAATVLPTVTVTGAAAGGSSALPDVYAGGAVARGGRLGMLGNTDIMDTPFNVTSYTSQLMTNRQSVTLADALNIDPSVRFTGQIGGITDSFYVRGFPIGEGNLGEIAFDGVYGVAPNYHVFTQYIERAEVLKGPGAMLYGISPNSGVGGVINIVPKRSLPEDLTRLTTDYTSRGQGGVHADLSRKLDDEGRFGVRINALHRQGDTPLDNQSARADVVALALDYQGDRFRSTLDLIGQNEKVDAPTRPFLLGAGVDAPSAPDGRRNITQPWGWWKSDGLSALLRAEYDITDKWTAYADVGGSETNVSRLSDQTPIILNDAGDTSAVPTYYRFIVDRSTYNAGLRGKLDTGPIKHAVSLQASMYSDRVSQANRPGTAVLSNIYRPIDRPAQNIAAPGTVPKVSSSELSGLSLADTLSAFDERAQLTLGVRHQRIDSKNFSAINGTTTAHYDESATTPLAGLVIKPWENVSLYANYIQGLSKGDIAPATASNSGEVFAPYKSKQHEVGIKVDFDRALLTLSAFQVTKPSGQLTGSVYAADSEQRNRGLELNLSGEPVKGLRILGGMSLIDGELTRTNSPATIGNRPVGVPRMMANLGAEWDLPWVPGLSLNSYVTYTGKSYVNQANTQSVPAWTTVDLGAAYALKVQGRDVTIRGTVINAFNRAYWSGVASYGTISQGVPRTFVLSASMDF